MGYSKFIFLWSIGAAASLARSQRRTKSAGHPRRPARSTGLRRSSRNHPPLPPLDALAVGLRTQSSRLTPRRIEVMSAAAFPSMRRAIPSLAVLLTSLVLASATPALLAQQDVHAALIAAKNRKPVPAFDLANASAAAAGYYPTLSATGSAERQRYSTALKFPPFGGLANTFEAGFDALWEIDIFGKTRRAVEAADASVDASIESRRDVRLSLLAELGQDYATLRSAQVRLAIAQRNIRVDQDALDLTWEKYKAGSATSSTWPRPRRNSNAQCRGAAAPDPGRPAVPRHRRAAGPGAGCPRGGTRRAGAAAAGTADLAGHPRRSDAVRNRPDIRAAERQIAGLNAQIWCRDCPDVPDLLDFALVRPGRRFAAPSVERRRAAVGRRPPRSRCRCSRAAGSRRTWPRPRRSPRRIG